MDGPVCGPCAGALRPGGLRRQPGSDPDAAARRVFVTWNGVFGGLPRDGQYAASIAMIEAENGYYIAVDVNVVRAGTQHDDSDDEPEKPEEPFTVDKDGNYTVNAPDGLQTLYETLGKDGIKTANITLNSDVTLTDKWPDDVYSNDENPAIYFSGTLNGNGHTITINNNRKFGLFREIKEGGKVEDLNINVTGSISASGGTYAAINAGGVAGDNSFGSSITGCTVTIESGSSIRADGTGTAYAGGVVGKNSGTVDGNTVEDSNNPKLPEIGNQS